MRKHLFIAAWAIIALTAVYLQAGGQAHALQITSARLQPIHTLAEVKPNHEKILQDFLEEKNSPLAPHARDFIDAAEKNNLDWKLVVSISGVESYFGRRIPYESYNGWGWGVYGDNVINFASWTDAIETISASIKTKYMDKWDATTVEEIGAIYAADPNWSKKVRNFMNQIETYKGKKEATSLSISI